MEEDALAFNCGRFPWAIKGVAWSLYLAVALHAKLILCP